MADSKIRPAEPGLLVATEKGQPITEPDSTTDTSSAVSAVEGNGDATGQTQKWKRIQRIWTYTPKPARYDPQNPPKFTIWINILFSFVSARSAP